MSEAKETEEKTIESVAEEQKSAEETEEKAAEKETAEKSVEEKQTPAEEKKEEKKEKTGSENFDLTPEDEIKALKAELEDTKKLRLMALAEMDNQRKRQAREMESLRYNVTQDTVFPFLTVFDHFTMAVAASENSKSGSSFEALMKGMDMIQKEFAKAFDDLGIEVIDAMGKDFDPNLHEAVAEKNSDTVPQGKVMQQWSRGYKMGDKLLKAAMVVVSSGPAEKKDEKADQEKTKA